MPNILLVEDDPSTRFLLRTWLAPLGEISICNHGDEAWELIEEGITFDLIITDHEMPGLTGRALVEKIRAKAIYDHIPIIMVTASINPPEMAYLKIHSFLEKPFTPDILQAAVVAALQK